MAQPPQGFGFNLADALPGEPKSPPDLLQRVEFAVFQPKPHSQNSGFPEWQGVEDFIDLVAQQLGIDALAWRWRFLVLNKIA